MSGAGVVQGNKNAPQHSLTAEWSKSPRTVTKQRSNPQSFPASHRFVVPTHAQRGGIDEKNCSVPPRQECPPFARNVGRRPSSDLQSIASMDNTELLDHHKHRYHKLVLECKERSLQLEKIEEEGRIQTDKIVKLLDDISARVDQLCLLEKQICGALTKEFKKNKQLRENAIQRGYV
ncbi:hypothetical protein BCY84_03470 [Trypanosoma cruzi cruzi]|nr:hypothetical protein BCY84_18989 [Trypanosoma cruzi cruzi]PBJ79040.1 hypothetical protein BCY84_03470 [Trypanosoma cruzi cruzi]